MNTISTQQHSRLIFFFFIGFKDSVSEEDFDNALYAMDIGQNDLAGAFSYLSYAQVLDHIPSYISEIQSSILVHNTIMIINRIIYPYRYMSML